MLTYMREALLMFLAQAGADLPAELWRHQQGTRARAKESARRQKNSRLKPCLLSIILGKVRMLTNKKEELATLVNSQCEYQECNLLCFTETWLKMYIPDCLVELDVFILV